MIKDIKKYWRYFKWVVVILVLVSYFFYQPTTHKERVELNRCIDGDTAAFFIQQEEVKVRFLLVDTPEIATHDAYSQEAKEYTCRFLQEAKVIELENDGDDVKYDKYGRRLAWVFGDGNALDQAKKLKKGLYSQDGGE